MGVIQKKVNNLSYISCYFVFSSEYTCVTFFMHKKGPETGKHSLNRNVTSGKQVKAITFYVFSPWFSTNSKDEAYPQQNFMLLVPLFRG